MNGLSCKLLVVLVACGFSQTVPIIPQAHSAQLIQTQFLIQSTALHFSPAIRDKERDPRVTRAVCFTSQISQLWVFPFQSREPTGLISVRHKTGHRPFTTLVFTLQRETWKRSIITDLGPCSWKISVLRVAPSNNIIRKFLEMWAFPLKIKEKILVKKKVIQKAF